MRELLEFLRLPRETFAWSAFEALGVRGSSFVGEQVEGLDWSGEEPAPEGFDPIGRWRSWTEREVRRFHAVAAAESRTGGTRTPGSRREPAAPVRRHRPPALGDHRVDPAPEHASGGGGHIRVGRVRAAGHPVSGISAEPATRLSRPPRAERGSRDATREGVDQPALRGRVPLPAVAASRHGYRAGAVADLLSRTLRRARVGDKLPRYVFELDDLAPREGLARIVIVRDCRLVTASTLARVRTAWSGLSWTERIDTPAKVAANWCSARERRAEPVASARRAIRGPVDDPRRCVERLAAYLDVDAGAFDTSLVRRPDFKLDQLLDPSGRAAVEEVAGEAMHRWGYDGA